MLRQAAQLQVDINGIYKALMASNANVPGICDIASVCHGAMDNTAVVAYPIHPALSMGRSTYRAATPTADHRAGHQLQAG